VEALLGLLDGDFGKGESVSNGGVSNGNGVSNGDGVGNGDGVNNGEVLNDRERVSVGSCVHVW
jgi:hypothetical protein